MFSISPAPAALAKRASKACSSANVMFSCLRPPFGLGFMALLPPSPPSGASVTSKTRQLGPVAVRWAPARSRSYGHPIFTAHVGGGFGVGVGERPVAYLHGPDEIGL